MAKKISENAIPDINADWGKDASNGLPYSGQAVQTFIKNMFGSKAGYFIIDAGYLYVFANEDDYSSWVSNPDDKYLICPKVKLPSSSETSTDALAIYGIDTTQYYTKGAPKITLKFKVRNIVDGADNTDIAVSITSKTGVSLFNVTRPTADTDGYYTAELAGSNFGNKPNTSEQITLTVTRTGEVRSVSRNLSIHCVDLSLALYSSYNFGIVNPADIDYVPTFTLPSGMTAIKLCVDVYRSSTEVWKHIETSSITTNNKSSVDLDWSDLPFSGVYPVKAYLDMGNGLVQSNVVETNLMAIKSGEESTTVLVAVDPIGEVTLYDDVTPHFAVYYMGKATAKVKITLNNGTPTILNIPTGRVYSSYTCQAEQASNTLMVAALNDDDQSANVGIETFTASGSFNWKITSGYNMNLVAKGRSNEEQPSPAHWGYKSDGTTELTTFKNVGFSNYGSGWTGSTLHLVGGGKAVVDCPIFYGSTEYKEGTIGGGILDTGRTFRIRFKVDNVVDATKKLISCWDGNVGFYVTGDTIYVKFGNNGEITTDPLTDAQATQNNRHFNAGEIVELCITVEPLYDESYNTTKKIVTMYVNGQFAGEAMLSETGISQTSALPITLDSEGAELDVYQMTSYEKCLNSFEVLQNYVMGLSSLSEMKDEFNKNQCYTGSGTVNFNETFKYCKWLSAKLGDTVDGALNIIVNTHEFDPSISDTDTIATGQQELELFFFKNGEVDTDRSVKYVGINTKDLRVCIQGTSTAYEWRKNMRYDSKGTVKEYRWSKEAYEASGSVNPSDGWVYKEDVKKLQIYLRGDSTTENACKLLTVKTNYNESTSTRNLPMARWSDDAMRYLSTVKDGDGNLVFPNILTPPQKADSKVRQCIDGVPAVQFTHDVDSQDYRFTGKVDLITDKKNASIFGFSEGGRDYSIEFRNGNSDITNFRCPYLKTAGKYLDGTFNSKGEDSFEYRWPDLDTGDTYYGDSYLGENSALQRLFDFVFNCHPDFVGYKSKNGVISLTNGIITIKGENRVDNATYRKEKFKTELKYYMVVDSACFNGLASKVWLWTDQRAKNQFFTHYTGDEVTADFTDDLNEKGITYEILRLLPYDIDTSERGDNASRLRYDFTRLYTDVDVYNDGVSVTTVSNAFYKTQTCIGEDNAATFISNRVMGKRSALYELLDDAMQDTYTKMFAELVKGGFFDINTVKKYNIANEVDAYNSVIYNADTVYKYIASGKTSDQCKAHGSAKEDLLWWGAGRLYFMGGENSAGDYTSTSFRAVMCMDSVLDDTNKKLRIPDGADGITLSIKSQYRNYIGTRLGTTGQLTKQYAEDPSQYYDVELITSGISNEDSGRFTIFGQKFFADVKDFSKLYIASITDWGGCTALKTLKFGDDAEGFNNPALTDIKGSGNLTFGAETLDLRNCTSYADSDFRCFPSLEELLLTGCDSLTELTLPVTENLVTLYVPKNLIKLEITDKPNISTMVIEGMDNMATINISEGNGEGVANGVLDALNVYYN